MENFIYSINVTMPIFLVMVIGYILKQIGMLNDNFVTVANKFNFKVTLPFMLFKDIAGVDIKAVFDIKYVLFCAIVSTICFWVVWVQQSFWCGTKRSAGHLYSRLSVEVRRLWGWLLSRISTVPLQWDR